LWVLAKANAPSIHLVLNNDLCLLRTFLGTVLGEDKMYSDAVLSVFSQRYANARDSFLSNVETSSAVEDVQHVAHPLKGPKNEKLYCDIVWAGHAKADNVLVLVSGIHGVEGGVGSAIQADFVSRHRRLPPDVCVVLVHAINPWGFAWASRNDAEGIDINRNFVDFEQPLPKSAATDIWAEWVAGKTDLASIASDREQFDVLSQGQYERADMPYFGGQAPSWSRTVIEDLVKKLKPAKRKKVTVIDLHSGLGPYGTGELICDHPIDSQGEKMARTLFGSTVTQPARHTSSSGEKFGLHDYFWHQQGDHVCFLTLEFGTFDSVRMLKVLSDDHELQQKGLRDWTDQKVLDIKHALQDYFCPTEKQWQELVLFRGRQVIEMALDGLTQQKT
jgi:hypothetical protein